MEKSTASLPRDRENLVLERGSVEEMVTRMVLEIEAGRKEVVGERIVVWFN